MPLSTFNFPLSTLANQLPDLPAGPSLDRVRGPVEIPTYETWQIALAAAFVLLLIASAIWLFLKSRHHKQIIIDPYDAAISELDTARNLTDGDAGRFATLCSGTVRRFFEDSLNIKCRTRTSEEFLRSLEGNTQLNSDYQSELAQTLQTLDKIKFASASLKETERNEILDTVRSLIVRAHKTTAKEGDEK